MICRIEWLKDEPKSLVEDSMSDVDYDNMEVEGEVDWYDDELDDEMPDILIIPMNCPAGITPFDGKGDAYVVDDPLYDKETGTYKGPTELDPDVLDEAIAKLIEQQGMLADAIKNMFTMVNPIEEEKITIDHPDFDKPIVVKPGDEFNVKIMNMLYGLNPNAPGAIRYLS